MYLRQSLHELHIHLLEPVRSNEVDAHVHTRVLQASIISSDTVKDRGGGRRPFRSGRGNSTHGHIECVREIAGVPPLIKHLCLQNRAEGLHMTQTHCQTCSMLGYG